MNYLLKYRSRLLSKEDQEDICQRVLISVARKEVLDRWNSDSYHFFNYVAGSVKRAVFDHLRGIHSMLPITVDPIDPRSEGQIKNLENKLFIEKMIEPLSPIQKEIVLSRLRGETFEEISKRTGQVKTTLRSNFIRGLKKMKENST